MNSFLHSTNILLSTAACLRSKPDGRSFFGIVTSGAELETKPRSLKVEGTPDNYVERESQESRLLFVLSKFGEI